MLDTHSDYALNKIDKEAIVCPCAGGDHIRLTRNDFASDEEFNYWKAWSDDDYRKIELGGRKDDACSLSPLSQAVVLAARPIPMLHGSRTRNTVYSIF